MTIGEKIQKLRKHRGLSQEALAEKVLVTRQTISKWELNQSTPDLEFIAQLSSFLVYPLITLKVFCFIVHYHFRRYDLLR